MKTSAPKNLLVIKNRALGDSVITFGVIQYLKEILPETNIVYAVPNWIKPLYDNLNSSADKIITLDFKDFSSWRKSRNILKEERIDTVLELFQSGRTAKFFKVNSLLAGPKYYFHNHHNKTGVVHDQGVIKANIQRDLDAAWTFFSDGEIPHYKNYSPKLMTKQEVAKEKKIIFGVVATRETKMWPLTSYRDLARMIQKEKPDYRIEIPLGPGDQKIERERLRLGLPDNSKIIKVKLDQLPLELATAEVYAGNDTGLKHICAAQDIPTITLFGPEPPKEWHPYNVEEHPFFFREPLECRTKDAHYCGLSTCDSMICLNNFTPDQVYQKLLGFI
jgi:heptosyltransferase-2